MCWHRECEDYQAALLAWHEKPTNKMDSDAEKKILSREFVENRKCPRKLSEEETKNLLIGSIGGGVVLIGCIVAFGMWRKSYVKVHTHVETNEEMEEAEE